MSNANAYEHDRWEWRIQDVLGRKFADALGLSCENKWGAPYRVILAQKPMMYLPARSIRKMITGNASATPSSLDCWHACSEFLDLADALTVHAEPEKI